MTNDVGKIVKFNYWYKFLKSNYPDNTAHGGAAILIKHSIQFQPLPHFCLDYLQPCALIIKLNYNPTTIAAIYSPPKHKIAIQH